MEHENSLKRECSLMMYDYFAAVRANSVTVGVYSVYSSDFSSEERRTATVVEAT